MERVERIQPGLVVFSEGIRFYGQTVAEAEEIGGPVRF